MKCSSLSIAALFVDGVLRKNHYSILGVKYICAKLRDFSGYDDFNCGRFEKAIFNFPCWWLAICLILVKRLPTNRR